ncbi:hypothetical protein BC826DRAFT_247886 [Russula brevipes]|nr:hypothetical protein BC826DRAFT_247886 [Russula brevipes]
MRQASVWTGNAPSDGTPSPAPVQNTSLWQLTSPQHGHTYPLLFITRMPSTGTFTARVNGSHFTVSIRANGLRRRDDDGRQAWTGAMCPKQRYEFVGRPLRKFIHPPSHDGRPVNAAAHDDHQPSILACSQRASPGNCRIMAFVFVLRTTPHDRVALL